MYLKSNRPFTRLMMATRESAGNRWVPVKHLYERDIRPPIRELEDQGLLNVMYDKEAGYAINLTKKGYNLAKGFMSS